METIADQVLTAAQMRAAEEALIARESSVSALMDRAGAGAAEWVWRAGAGHGVTVLCGPGNNGGDGYVIARRIAERGGRARVIAPRPPGTDAARAARAAWEAAGGAVLGSEADPHGEVLVDCLFGTGLTRPLDPADAGLLARLAGGHRLRIAVDLPSGVASDTGAVLVEGLPKFQLTLALGAWKPGHFLMPAAAAMGALRLVPIGIGAVPGVATRLMRPRFAAPAPDAHKYSRGLAGVVAGAMPGAALLGCLAAQRGGAGYVKLLGSAPRGCPPDLVADPRALADALADPRYRALLVGPGLGRAAAARAALEAVVARAAPTVFDADALMLLSPADRLPAAAILTPHAGELAALAEAFALDPALAKPALACALAAASGAVVVAKGPDTLIAAPDGRLAFAGRASPWLSTAGTGDVLAGLAVSRLAVHGDPFAAAGEAVWLHAEAARGLATPFSAGELAGAVRL